MLLSARDLKIFMFVVFVLNRISDNRNEIFDIPVSRFDDLKILFEDRYPIEDHQIITKDGYIITVHRIPSAQVFNSSFCSLSHNKKPPVYLHHALALDSSTWMWSMSNNVVLPFILSDAGYDVWLGNSRGNYYSRNHIKLDYKTSKDYWDFTWHEIGTYDLPAVIDYILEETNSEKIHYIGHSQGTSAAFVLMSEVPNYNKKILSFHAITPTVFMQNSSSPYVQYLSDKYGDQNEIYTELSKKPPPLIIHRLSRIAASFCKFFRTAKFCSALYGHIFGKDAVQINEETAINIFLNTPQAASLKSVLHFFQIVKSGRFRKYDYGEKKNYKMYRSAQPLDYDLKKITCPVFLYYSKEDKFSSYSGCIKLSHEIRKEALYLNYSVPEIYKFGHLDFIHGKFSRELIFKKILNSFDELEKRGLY